MQSIRKGELRAQAPPPPQRSMQVKIVVSESGSTTFVCPQLRRGATWIFQPIKMKNASVTHTAAPQPGLGGVCILRQTIYSSMSGRKVLKGLNKINLTRIYGPKDGHWGDLAIIAKVYLFGHHRPFPT
jgi:hypothetical protein